MNDAQLKLSNYQNLDQSIDRELNEMSDEHNSTDSDLFDFVFMFLEALEGFQFTIDWCVHLA